MYTEGRNPLIDIVYVQWRRWGDEGKY